MPILTYLFFWNHKQPEHNAWHPLPGDNPIKTLTTLPAWTAHLDPEATAIDAAPLILAAGAFTHLRQLNDLGWTVPANIFTNPRTLRAVHRATLLTVPAILAAQLATGSDYRYAIPRWAHERERGRDELQVRRHVQVGMALGVLGYVARMTVLPRAARVCWAPVEVVLGGGLADLMHREFVKAHGYEPSVG